jgi:NAD(P)H dehydrogenase (quinone)
MAEAIAEGASKKGCEVTLKAVAETVPDDFLKSHAVIIGSPTYYGTMSHEVKKLIDESVKHHGKLEGRVGGAFSSSGMLGGGNETTVRSILDALLIHGMIVVGSARTAHYGPVAVGKPDDKARKECRAYGERIATLVRLITD